MGLCLPLKKLCYRSCLLPPALIKINGLLFVMKLVLLFIAAGAYFVLVTCYVLESGVSDVMSTSYPCSIVVHKVTQFFGNRCLLWFLLTVWGLFALN